MNPQQLLPFIGVTLSIGGIIFQTGKHAEKIDFVFGKVEAQEKKVEYTDYHMPIPYSQYKDVIEKIYNLSVQNGFI